MELTRVQRIRFLECISDLEKLIALIAKEHMLPARSNQRLFKARVVQALMKATSDKYVLTGLGRRGMGLVLRVNELGKIMGYVSLDYKRKALVDPEKNRVQLIFNNFIERSSLLDPLVEYYPD